jgi:putative Holliday junction resolvase
MTMPHQPYEILALDVGAARIGVARASSIVRLPEPLVTLTQDARTVERIKQLVIEHDAKELVVGLPRGLEGQETAQTASVREFVATLSQELSIPILFQDEAVTSVKAEEELIARGKPYGKGDIDALAATYILDDYLKSQHGKIRGII